MIYEKQSHIKTGFVDYHGYKWSKHEVALYNAMTDDINKSAGFEVEPDSLTQKERDVWLDRRHKLFIAIANPAA